MTVELVYMQYNISDSQALFSSFALTILKMAGLDTFLLCSVGQQAWLCSWLVVKFFTKIKAVVLIKLFLQKRECITDPDIFLLEKVRYEINVRVTFY